MRLCQCDPQFSKQEKRDTVMQLLPGMTGIHEPQQCALSGRSKKGLHDRYHRITSLMQATVLIFHIICLLVAVAINCFRASVAAKYLSIRRSFEAGGAHMRLKNRIRIRIPLDAPNLHAALLPIRAPCVNSPAPAMSKDRLCIFSTSATCTLRSEFQNHSSLHLFRQ
jgi:hypothetical protein